ncbi:MAG: ABC transporter permease [Gemmataceae bacterium]
MPTSNPTWTRTAYLFWSALGARAYPRLVWLVRAPSWLLQETLLPLLGIAAFVLVYRTFGAPPAFEGFVVLGGTMSAFWLNVLWSMGAQLYWERDAGNLELYIIAPAPMMAILAGMALGGICTTLVRATVILLAGSIIFDVHLGHPETSWLAVAGVFVVTLLALYGLGMCFASAFLLWGREAWHTVHLLQEPVYLLSGVNYPLRYLGQPTAWAASLIPMSLGIDALRQLLFPPEQAVGFLPVPAELALLTVLTIAYLILARWLLAVLEKKARAEGRLILKQH